MRRVFRFTFTHEALSDPRIPIYVVGRMEWARLKLLETMTPDEASDGSVHTRVFALPDRKVTCFELQWIMDT